MRERHGHDLYLGKDVEIGADVTVGRYTSLGDHASAKRCSIGNFCSIANRVAINPWNHPTDWLSTHEFQFRDDSYGTEEYKAIRKLPRPHLDKRVTIGNDVWIGIGATIFADVGHGAIIGAGAIITKPVLPYMIYGGSPAKFIRSRFPPRKVDRLLNLAWWDLPLSMLDGLPFDNIEQCLDILEERCRSR